MLSGRTPPPFSLRRLKVDGELTELNAAQLAFTAEETRVVAGQDVHDVTGGWPIAVRLVAETGTVEELGDLVDEVVGREPEQTRELLRTAAAFDRFTADLLTALGHGEAGAILPDLARRGLFVEHVRAEPGWFTLVPLAREYLTPASGVHAGAARWFAGRGEYVRAADSLAALEDWGGVTALLGDVLRSKGADAVLDATGLIPENERTAEVWQLEGVAHQLRGEWRQAADRFTKATEDGLTAELAWRMAWIQHLRGGPQDALKICDECVPDGGDPTAESMLLSTAASAHWALGDLEAAETKAIEALKTATNDGAIGTAHTVLAMVAAAQGKRDELTEHYDIALDHAQKAGDVLGVIRIRSNRASHHVEAGERRAALQEIEEMLPLADVTGFATYRAIGLHNRGEALLGLGRLDEAAADFHAAQQVFDRAGSWLAAAPLVYLGEVHRLRGDRALAGFALREALRLASAKNTVPHMMLANVGLAELFERDDPDLAKEHARKALDLGESVAALLVLARLDQAKDLCQEAAEVATRRGDRAGFAKALELQGSLERDSVLLDQALTLWREVGDPLGEVRVRTAQAALVGGAAGEQLAGEARLQAADLGARILAEAAAAVAETCRKASRPALFIQTLGGFRVLRDGEPLPPAAWQSRKARDLVKILIARRGRPITREALGNRAVAGRGTGAGREPAGGGVVHGPQRAQGGHRNRRRGGRDPDRHGGAARRRRRFPRRRTGGTRCGTTELVRGPVAARRRRVRLSRRLPGGGPVRGLGRAAARGSQVDLPAGGGGARRTGRVRWGLRAGQQVLPARTGTRPVRRAGAPDAGARPRRRR